MILGKLYRSFLEFKVGWKIVSVALVIVAIIYISIICFEALPQPLQIILTKPFSLVVLLIMLLSIFIIDRFGGKKMDMRTVMDPEKYKDDDIEFTALQVGNKKDYGAKITYNDRIFICAIVAAKHRYLLSKIKIVWKYVAGYQGSIEYIDKSDPQLEVTVNLCIDPRDNSKHIEIVELKDKILISPDNYGEGFFNFKLELQYSFKDPNFNWHPSFDWNIFYDVILLDDRGKEHLVLKNYKWRDVDYGYS